ncbi:MULTISPECIES: ATP-binding protein [unclassified Caballeronia]|uniref:ATP-binding protein n=1 Tax=unclassified Caballeronia TaxID=2646786 RepID=UPI002027E6E5|nr:MULTISPECIES: ATP-binding protein [unclassified Caballeronia]
MKFRFGIASKIFLLVLVACLVITLTMGYAVRVSFENGFLHYVRERDAGRERAVMAKVASEYAAHGNWAFLRGNDDAWLALLDDAQEQFVRREIEDMRATVPSAWRSFPGSGSVARILGPLGEPWHGPHWGMRPSNALPNPSPFAPPESAPLRDSLNTAPEIESADRVRGHRRERPPAALFDADRALVASTNEPPPPDAPASPVRVHGKVVGWLATAGPTPLTDAADIAFQAQQMRATWQIGGVAVILAAVVAMVLARLVLVPVRRVMAATHRLASGDYSIRVPAKNRDELDKLASDFNSLADSLERAERCRREFIADVSHELRTPLAVLRSELEAIEDGVHVFDAASLASLQTEVAALNKLIEDLYDLSLSDVGMLRYRKAPAQVNALTRASVDAMRQSFRAKRLAIDVECSDALASADVDVDAARFVQLLKNLLQNSLRYTDPNGRVRVALAGAPDDWTLNVQDSSPGVPTSALPHLFDRFYRVDESRSRQSGGAGLGLSLCKAIVTAHGGSIRADDSAHGGVSITARFPSHRE